MDDNGRTTANTLIRLATGFEPVSIEDWRASVVRGLGGGDLSSLESRTANGIDLQPVYDAADDPVLATRPGGMGWDIVTLADYPEPEDANRQLRRDIEGGATCLSIAFEHAASAGGFGLQASEGALAAALQDIVLNHIHMRIEPHPLGRRSAEWLASYFNDPSTRPTGNSVSFGLDPVGNFARWGALSVEEDIVANRLAGTISMLRGKGFSGRFAEADGRCYHAAGAADGQELGIVMATAAWYLRACTSHGGDAGQAFSAIGVSLAASQQQLVTIAKMRAIRILWLRLQELCGCEPSGLWLHAETARRMMMRKDPQTNILRSTLAAFAAGTGGANSIAILPHSWAAGLADRAARRIARNLHHLLLEESNVHRVADPAAGSGVIGNLTDGLCRTAWAEFQTIESEGGIVASLADGKVQARIAASRAMLQGALADGDAVLVGATRFPDPSPPEVATIVVDRRPDPRFSEIALTCEQVSPMGQPGLSDAAP